MAKLTKPERHLKVCMEMHDLYCKKNKDYGDSFHKSYAKWGVVSALIRINDKLNRLEELAAPNAQQLVKEESIRDTLIDLANYAIMTVLEMEGAGDE